MNQDYQTQQPQEENKSKNCQLTTNNGDDDVSNTKNLRSLVGNLNNNNNNNNGNSGNNGIINDNSDVIMPLLLPNNQCENISNDVVEITNSTNSNNLNSNHVVSEKEALLQDAN